MEKNRITELFGIKYPIVQGGMVWCSGWRLASAVSNAGGLGLLGAGSMHPETLEEHIAKMKEATDKPWGVNVPLMYPEIDRLMKLIIDSGVKIVFTSAGSPKKFTPMLHEAGITVVHVVSSSKFARKCEEAGVDAIVAEGFEAGGHNGREETTTMTLIPQVRHATNLPLIAAGGIASGEAILASMVLGAEGVQIGTLFALTEESSASEAFKQRCISTEEGDTMLCLKKIAPTRLIKNSLYDKVKDIPFVRVMYPVQVNGVFVQMPRHIWTELQKQYFFYDWDMDNDVVRWLCSFDTTEDDINSFVEALKRLG